jgi:hypothetical protein
MAGCCFVSCRPVIGGNHRRAIELGLPGLQPLHRDLSARCQTLRDGLRLRRLQAKELALSTSAFTPLMNLHATGHAVYSEVFAGAAEKGGIAGGAEDIDCR